MIPALVAFFGGIVIGMISGWAMKRLYRDDFGLPWRNDEQFDDDEW